MPSLPEQVLIELQARCSAVPGIVIPPGASLIDRGDVAYTERGDRPAVAILETGHRITASQCGCYWSIAMQPQVRITADSAATRDSVTNAVIASLQAAWPVMGVTVLPVDAKSLVARVDSSPWAYLVQLEVKGLRCKAYHLDQAAN